MSNLFNNNSILDNNLLSHGLILVSFSVIGFSMYYFTTNLFKQNVDKVTDNLPNLNNQDIITQNVVKNLEAKNISNLDIIVPKSSLNSEVDILLHKADACVQTGSGILNRTDIDVTRYTDQGLFIPWEGNLKSAMQELLYGMESNYPSIAEMTPSEFADQIRNNEASSRYFEKISNWVDSVPPHVASSNGSYNSEISFIRQVLENLNSTPTSPIAELNVTSPVAEISQGSIDELRMSKFDEIISYLSQNYPQLTGDPVIKDWVQNMINSYDYDQLLLLSINSEIINKINCNIILWSHVMF